MVKRCARCKLEKQDTEFYSLSVSKDGLHSWCRACCYDGVKRDRAGHLTARREHAREYTRLNREKIRAYHEKWRNAHEGKARDYSRWHLLRHRERHRVGARLRQLGLRQLEGSHTEDEWDELLEAFEHKCFGCGITDVELTRDHITPVSKGGTDNIDNIFPLCRSCNSKKGVKGQWWYLEYWAKLAKKEINLMYVVKIGEMKQKLAKLAENAF
jgi:5-methylcytosine-specific restriction endonuclease McrA